MTLTAWRVVKTKWAASAFDGEGASLNGGRWNSVGMPVVYLADTPAVAVLEVLTGLDTAALVPAYTLFEVRFDESLAADIPPNRLPKNWFQVPPPAECAAVGDDWLRTGSTPVLRVPSVVLLSGTTPQHMNYLLSPSHRLFDQVKIGPARPLQIDSRLLKRDAKA